MRRKGHPQKRDRPRLVVTIVEQPSGDLRDDCVKTIGSCSQEQDATIGLRYGCGYALVRAQARRQRYRPVAQTALGKDALDGDTCGVCPDTCTGRENRLRVLPQCAGSVAQLIARAPCVERR